MKTTKHTGPLVTVIMPVHSEPQTWLSAAIESILKQSERSLELITILDNPQNKKALRILEQFARRDTRVKVITNAQNIGRGASRNAGISHAQGKYIAILDADDIAYPKRLAIELKYLNTHARVDIVCAGAVFISPQGKPIKTFTPRATAGQAAQAQFFGEESFIHSTLLARKQVFDTHSYDPTFTRSQDYEFLTRALRNGCTLGFIEEPLVQYRTPGHSNYEERVRKQRETLRHATRLFWKHLPAFWKDRGYRSRTARTTSLLLATHVVPQAALIRYLRRRERAAMDAKSSR